MKKIVRTRDGKSLVINPEADTCIIRMPRPATRTGTDYLQGEDLYMTTDATGDRHFYVISWTAWSRDNKESYRVITTEQKDQFIRDQVKKAGKIGLDPDVADRIEKFFPGLLKRLKSP
jgi:hypothetical protein